MRLEDKIQKSIVDYLEAVVPHAFVYAIPNAAKRQRGKRAGNAVPGLRKGMPDLCFLTDRARFFEVKQPSKEQLSQAQFDCHLDLRALGYQVATVTSIEDVRAWLEYWHVHTREVVIAA